MSGHGIPCVGSSSCTARARGRRFVAPLPRPRCCACSRGDPVVHRLGTRVPCHELGLLLIGSPFLPVAISLSLNLDDWQRLWFVYLAYLPNREVAISQIPPFASVVYSNRGGRLSILDPGRYLSVVGHYKPRHCAESALARGTSRS